MAPCLRFLRPYALQPISRGAPSRCSTYLRFYEVTRPGGDLTCQRRKSTRATDAPGAGDYKPEERGALIARRIDQLKKANALKYPRLEYSKGDPMTLSQFINSYEKSSREELDLVNSHITIIGRVLHVRQFGSKFFFVKVVENGKMLQAQVNFGKLKDGTELQDFKQLTKLIARGDHISITGRPGRTDTEQLCIEALSLPEMISPSLVPLPFRLPEESRMQQRHMDLIVNQPARDILITRSHITNCLRTHLQKVLDCVEVQTPILAANAGGAVARPFDTRATEFSHKELALRIAPELWLKRLVAGGLERIYELGPAFRNEGLDATHNPEFTMCEFYLAHATLDHLMTITENLFASIADSLQGFVESNQINLELPDPAIFKAKFKRLEFIPALEEAIGHPLPDLDSPTAISDILQLLQNAGKDWQLPPSSISSLPKLLDHMAGAVLEPESKDQALFITHHPVCMSPLSKSFTCPRTGQQVAARAELFYDGNELANMYEEENDPFEQRRKFVEQARARVVQQGEILADDEELPHIVDEQYIQVLESGLPPTGGWGCGVDRLVMLFTGAKRINDVLPFGNLRNVVRLASTGSQQQ